MAEINTVIFDLGGVLIDWNPRYVYRSIFADEEKMEWFLENICTPDWNERQDEGYPIGKATEELVQQHPGWEHEIRAYYGRWEEMLAGPIPESVEIFRKLKENSGLKLYALTNWSAELFPIALQRYDFLHWFHGRVVSGEEKTRKPFPEMYKRLLTRYEVKPAEALFIDDSLRNVKAAERIGLIAIQFLNPAQLKGELGKYSLLKV
jgi:2-haloacid dehalogenase